MKIVRLKWIDSAHSFGWKNPAEVKFTKKTLLHESVGFLLKETSYSYILIQSKGLHMKTQAGIDAIMEIPKAAVLKVTTL